MSNNVHGTTGVRPMSSKERVLAVHPHAFCRKWGGWREGEEGSTVWDGVSAKPIGGGACESEAWDDAASRIPASTEDAAPTEGLSNLPPNKMTARAGVAIGTIAISTPFGPSTPSPEVARMDTQELPPLDLYPTHARGELMYANKEVEAFRDAAHATIERLQGEVANLAGNLEMAEGIIEQLNGCPKCGSLARCFSVAGCDAPWHTEKAEAELERLFPKEGA